MLSPRRSVSSKRSSVSRMHLIRIAEALDKQFKQRQRADCFTKWKLFVVMKAVSSVVQLSSAVTPSTTNGGGPIPLTLLIRAGKRATIKKRVLSTTRIYKSTISPNMEASSNASPTLGQLTSQTPQAAQASASGVSVMVSSDPWIPPFFRNQSNNSSGAASRLVGNAPTTSSTPPVSPSTMYERGSAGNGAGGSDGVEEFPPVANAPSIAEGFADFLNGIGSCGAASSPALPNDMPLASLIREVQTLRSTVETQKRTIDMRDRYINELIRKQDMDLSLRDIERDYVLQQAFSKLDGLKGGPNRPRAGSRTTAAGVGGAGGSSSATVSSPTSAPLALQGGNGKGLPTQPPPMECHCTQTTPLEPPGAAAFAPSSGPMESSGKGNPPPTVPTPPSPTEAQPPRSARDVTSGKGSTHRAGPRNSIDNGSFPLSSIAANAPGGVGPTTTHRRVESVSNLSGTVSSTAANSASGVKLRGRPTGAGSAATIATPTGSATNGNPNATTPAAPAATTSLSSSTQPASRKLASHESNGPVQMLMSNCINPQLVSLAISSVMRPQVNPANQSTNHGDTESHPASDIAMLSSRSAQASNGSSSTNGSGGTASQPTSSRKVPALRGTSLLPILMQQQQQQAVLSSTSGASVSK